MKNLKIFKRKINNKLSVIVLKILSFFPVYIKLSFFPKKLQKINTNYFLEASREENIGIIVQGPPILIGDFTYETLKYYKNSKFFSTVVFSTTSKLSKDWEEKVKNLDIIVLKNTPPLNLGSFNIGHQIINSLEGVKEIKKQTCTFCVKTRSDQRLYRLGVIYTLINLLKTFPVEENSFLNNRIIFSSFTKKYISHHLGDFFQFGKTSDIYFFFKSALDNYLYENLFKTTVPEIIFCLSFLKNLSFPVKNTLGNYYLFLKKYCIICDHLFLDLHWVKYHNLFINSLNPSFNIYNNYTDFWKENLSFQDWLNIYYTDEYLLRNASVEKNNIVLPDSYKKSFFK